MRVHFHVICTSGGGGLHSRIWRASSLNVTLHNHANFHLLGSVSNQHDADVSSGGVDPEHPGCTLEEGILSATVPRPAFGPAAGRIGHRRPSQNFICSRLCGKLCLTLIRARHRFHLAVSSLVSAPNRQGPWQRASVKHARRQQIGPVKKLEWLRRRKLT